MKPLVTLAITTLNRVTYLAETLACVRAQDYPNLEILISDNGSSDETPSRVRELMGADSRVRFRRNAVTVPFSEHCSQCVDAARGDYFVLLHDDDCINSTFITKLVETASRYPDANVVVPANALMDSGGVVFRRFEVPVAEVHEGVPFLLHWLRGDEPQYIANLTTVMYRTASLRHFGAYRNLVGTRNNDNLLFLQVGMTGRVAFCSEAVFSWRIHPQNLGDSEPAQLIAASGREFIRQLRGDQQTVAALRRLSISEAGAIRREVAKSTTKEVIRHIHGQKLTCDWRLVRALLSERQDLVFVGEVLREYFRYAFPRLYLTLHLIRKKVEGASHDAARARLKTAIVTLSALLW